MSDIDGFYAVYFTSKAGYGAAMVALHVGKIIGADPAGVRLDGTYRKVAGDEYDVKVNVDVPAGVALVQGNAVAGPTGSQYEIRFGFRERPDKAPYLRMETPLGSLNVKFVRLRGFDD